MAQHAQFWCTQGLKDNIQVLSFKSIALAVLAPTCRQEKSDKFQTLMVPSAEEVAKHWNKETNQLWVQHAMIRTWTLRKTPNEKHWSRERQRVKHTCTSTSVISPSLPWNESNQPLLSIPLSPFLLLTPPPPQTPSDYLSQSDHT